MPEIPDELDQYVVDELASQDTRMVQVPLGALRSLDRDAKAYRREHGQHGQQGGQGAVGNAPALSPAEAANVAAGWNPDGSVRLEPGEETLTQQRRGLTAGSPPDRPALADPYVEAGRLFERLVDQGMQEGRAWGAALNHVVASVVRGDRRPVIRTSPGQGTQVREG